MKRIEVKVDSETLSFAPKYQTICSSGADLRAKLEDSIVIESQERAVIPTGIRMAIPEGYEGQIRSRSGLAARNGIMVLNSPGTIDSDYRGEIKVILYNTSKEAFTVEPEMRIAQMVFAPCFTADFTSFDLIQMSTSRGESGFGSTGLK